MRANGVHPNTEIYFILTVLMLSPIMQIEASHAQTFSHTINRNIFTHYK